MSLVVSLRIPDGIVIAADSVSMVTASFGMAGDAEATCPHCSKQFAVADIHLPPMPMAASTTSFTQKLLPFHEKAAVALFGMTAVGDRTTAYHVRKLQSTTQASDFSGVSEVADALAGHVHKQLQQDISDLQDAPDDFTPLGIQVVGYDGDQTRTVELCIGKTISRTEHVGIGCDISGDTDCVSHIWDGSMSGKTIPLPNFDAFSLQDAVEYAEFLIDLTASLHRFSPMLPTVGGDVDIGLITEFRGFTWVKCRGFTRLLHDRVGGNDNGDK